MKSLAGNTTLHTLVARQNKMGNATAQALGTTLLQNQALTTLNIAWNGIGPTGGAYIASGLQYNATLEVCVVRVPLPSLLHRCAPN